MTLTDSALSLLGHEWGWTKWCADRLAYFNRTRVRFTRACGHEAETVVPDVYADELLVRTLSDLTNNCDECSVVAKQREAIERLVAATKAAVLAWASAVVDDTMKRMMLLELH